MLYGLGVREGVGIWVRDKEGLLYRLRVGVALLVRV